MCVYLLSIHNMQKIQVCCLSNTLHTAQKHLCLIVQNSLHMRFYLWKGYTTRYSRHLQPHLSRFVESPPHKYESNKEIKKHNQNYILIEPCQQEFSHDQIWLPVVEKNQLNIIVYPPTTTGYNCKLLLAKSKIVSTQYGQKVHFRLATSLNTYNFNWLQTKQKNHSVLTRICQ